MTRAPEFSDQFFFAYGEACAWASLLELKMRILADNTPCLEHLAHASSLEAVEKGIATAFAVRLQPGDALLLAKTRFLRNKVMHGNFSKAKEALIELGAIVPDGGVLSIDLSGTDTLDALQAGDRAPVSQTPTKDSTIYGWLLEGAQAGLFVKAIEVFKKTTEIVERLFIAP